MKALKAIVAVMGLMIVTLMVLIVYGFYQKTQDPDFKFFDLSSSKSAKQQAQPPLIPAPTPAPATASAPKTVFGTIDLDVPPGSRIVAVAPSGDTVLLTLQTPKADGADLLVIVDLTNGTVLGQVRLTP